MTANELALKFAREFGFKDWPVSYEVDADTYAHVCQAILDHALSIQFPSTFKEVFVLDIAVGPNNGLLFKNVELIFKH